MPLDPSNRGFGTEGSGLFDPFAPRGRFTAGNWNLGAEDRAYREHEMRHGWANSSPGPGLYGYNPYNSETPPPTSYGCGNSALIMPGYESPIT